MSSALSLLPAGASKPVRALAATVSIPWRGAWWAELDLDPDAIALAPTSGKATLTIGAAPGPVATLQGTIDPRYSGSFVAGAKARLVAGAGGWDKPVTAQDFSSPSTGVRSSDVYAATAALVGETVNVPSPSTLGAHVVRTSGGPGPASRVLGDQDWYVDFAGVTQIGSRPVATADASMQLLRFDPLEQRAELVCDTLVLPGTVLTDPRLNGTTPTVRDVEAVFDRRGTGRTTVWCALAPVSRLPAAFRALVREYAGVSHLKIYRYRYVQPSGGGIALQAVDPSAGAPDINPLAEGTGMAGVLAKLAPSTICYVGFVAGRNNDPILLSYDSSLTPINETIDATATVAVGPSALAVQLAGGTSALVVAPWAAGLATALATLATGLATGTLASMAGAGTALNTALGLLPPPATTRTTAS